MLSFHFDFVNLINTMFKFFGDKNKGKKNKMQYPQNGQFSYLSMNLNIR